MCGLSYESFPEYAAYLEAALANLCARASLAEPAHVPPNLAKAAGFCDRLRAA
jgi:hypothetical protein